MQKGVWTNLLAIFWHTVDCSAAIGSFMLISWLVRMALGPGLLSTGIHLLEQFTLVILLLVFVFNIVYDRLRELVRNVKAGQSALA